MKVSARLLGIIVPLGLDTDSSCRSGVGPRGQSRTICVFNNAYMATGAINEIKAAPKSVGR